MLNPVFSLCVYFVEMSISYIFFSNILEQRFSSPKCVIIGCGVFFIASAVNLVFNNNSTINGIVTYIAAFVFALVCFRAKIQQYFFYCAILVVSNTAFEITTIFMSSYVTGSGFRDYNNDLILLLFETITSKSLFFLFVLLMLKVIRPKGSYAKLPTSFFLYPVTATFCQIIFWHVCCQPNISYNIQLLLSLANGCLFISSILLFVTYSHQIKKDGEAMQIKSELDRLQVEKSYYQILDQQNQQLMIYAHDAKKHLAAIQALNDDPQIGDYVKALSQQLADYSRNCHSGNKLLDVIIHKYTVDCKMRGIQFEYDIKVCNLSQLDDIDLVAILGNLMDNAVAAAEDSAGKAISLNTVHRNSYSVIILTNSCDTPPKQAGDRLLSTKPDTQAHGFGLKSVKKTAQKYQGDLEWEYDAVAKQFTMTVMIADKKIECSANTSGNIR